MFTLLRTQKKHQFNGYSFEGVIILFNMFILYSRDLEEQSQREKTHTCALLLMQSWLQQI